jgi:ABC-type glycerol-3-phosphate transport system permease component
VSKTQIAPAVAGIRTARGVSAVRERPRIEGTVGPGGYVLVIALALLILTPFLWMLLGSFKPTVALRADQARALVSSEFTLDNYSRLFREYAYFANSTLVSVITAVVATCFSASAGYALARFRFPGRGIFGFAVLLTQMLPMVAVLIPLFIWFRQLYLVDTYWSMFIAYNAFAIPFGTWMLRGIFASLPESLEESARIDGAGELAIFFRIVLPVSRSGIFATAVFAFILAWQEFLFAVTFLNTDGKFTLTVGIAGMFGKEVIDWGLLNAAVVVTAVPVAIMFAFLQRYLVQGLTAGAVKG